MIDVKRILFVFVFLVSTISTSNPAAAHTKITVPELDTSKSNIVFQILEHGKVRSSIISGTTSDGKQRICKALNDSRCSSLDEFKVQIILPPCSAKSTSSDFCIRGVEMTGRDGKMIPATFLREVPTPRIAANTAAKIGVGGGISIWKFAPGKSKDPASEVATEVSLTYVVTKNKETNKVNLANLVDFKIAIHPVKYKSGKFAPLDFIITDGDSDLLGVNPSSGNLDDDSDCHWSEKGLCVAQGHFLDDTNVSISMQMDNKLKGWLSSQILDLKIQEKKISASANLLVIGGRASVSSPVYAINNVLDINKVRELKAAYNRCGDEVVVCPQAYEQYENVIWEGILTDNLKDAEFNIGLADVVSNGLADIQGVDSQWKVTSMPESNWRQGISWSPCVSKAKNLAGVVSTNASLYQMNPPEIQNQKLVSKVSGALKNAQSQINRVDYQVAMRADILRCLLKSNVTPSSVTASAFSKTGERLNYSEAAISEENGWVNFAAKKFSYSTPNIEFAFSNSPIKVVSKTISCSNGKKVVKVKGVTPKCPKGYKKV